MTARTLEFFIENRKVFFSLTFVVSIVSATRLPTTKSAVFGLIQN